MISDTTGRQTELNQLIHLGLIFIHFFGSIAVDTRAAVICNVNALRQYPAKLSSPRLSADASILPFAFTLITSVRPIEALTSNL
jgi:hypothetical protein